MKKEQIIEEVLRRNPFSLFSDHENYREATLSIFNLIERFMSELRNVTSEFAAVGATDSEAMEQISTYIAVSKLRMFRLVAGQEPIPREKFFAMIDSYNFSTKKAKQLKTPAAAEAGRTPDGRNERLSPISKPAISGPKSRDKTQ